MKKTAGLAALALLTICHVSVFISNDFHERAARFAFDHEKQSGLFKSSTVFFPWHDRAWLGLARALSGKAMDSLGEVETRDEALNTAVSSFGKALKLNPVSAAGHFYLGQTLLYMNYLQDSAAMPYFEEYRKAAELTGHNAELYFESGKVLLSRWSDLEETERSFTLEILKKALSGKDLKRLHDVLEIWLLQIGNPEVVEAVMPVDSAALRFYASFLGEKSFSLEPRQKALARAESLDLGKALEELAAGRREMDYFQEEKAEDLLRACLRRLDNIHFYGDLIGTEEAADFIAWSSARKQALSLLAVHQVGKTGSLDDPDGFIESYLEAEDQALEIGVFEKFLRERGILKDRQSGALDSEDLKTLAFGMDLDFRQHRYRDIARTGQMLEESTVVVPEGAKESYVSILNTIGNALLKLDYAYEAEKQFRQVLEIEPANFEALLGLAKSYSRLNDEERLLEIRKLTEAVLTPAVLPLGGRTVGKGTTLAVPLVCEEGQASFSMAIEGLRTGVDPLVTVFFNGRVVFENYLEAGPAEFAAVTKEGRNTLEITPVNEPVRILDLRWSKAGQAASGSH